MPAYYQLRRSAALWIVLAAGGELALDSQFQTASVSERLSMIREKVTALGGDQASQGVPLNEARNCYAGFWRNC
jgi:hypothetical protein